MKNNFIKEIVLAVLIIVLLVVLVNPFHFWMPDMAHMAVLVLLVLAFAGFAVFLFRERPQDEREVLNRSNAGRTAFLTGSIILIVGIIYQTFMSAFDPWLSLALGGMVVAKIAAVIYEELKN